MSVPRPAPRRLASWFVGLVVLIFPVDARAAARSAPHVPSGW